MPIHSMTGFGEQNILGDHWEVCIRLKTLNHRHLDTRISGLDRYPYLHLKVRNVLQQAFSRGRVDLEVELKRPKQVPSLRFDVELAEKYLEALTQIGHHLQLDQPPSLEFLLNMDGVTERITVEEENLWASLAPGLERAIEQAQRMRQKEGQHLVSELVEFITRLSQHKQTIEQRLPELKTLFRQRLLERIAALKEDIKFEEQRLEEEVILYTERGDISEELARLDSHFGAAQNALNGSEPAGKKLDFIAQEIGREINTIGSKVKDVQVSHTVIDMKSLLEKFREQVRNIE